MNVFDFFIGNISKPCDCIVCVFPEAMYYIVCIFPVAKYWLSIVNIYVYMLLNLELLNFRKSSINLPFEQYDVDATLRY